MRQRLAAMVRPLALAVMALALLAPRAEAHAAFRGSTPVAEAVLDAPPAAVTLRFSEPVGPLALDWLLPGGARAEARAQAVPDGLLVTAPPDAGHGTYALTWRVASTDGHPVGGSLVFSVGAAADGGPAPAP